MRFSDEELAQIYSYVADKLIAEGYFEKALKVEPLAVFEPPKYKGAFQAPPPPQMRNQEKDAGGHIPDSVLRVPSYAELKSHGMDMNHRE